MLQDLAGGAPPTAEELEFVLIAADGFDNKTDGEVPLVFMHGCVSDSSTRALSNNACLLKEILRG